MKEQFHSKLFLSWVMSYVFVLLLPLFIGSIVYVKSVNAISAEVTDVNEMALEQVRSVMDYHFSEFDHIASNISLDPDATKLITLKGQPVGKDMRAVLNVQHTLARYLMTTPLIDEIYFYDSKHDYIISTGYKYNADAIPRLCETAWGIDHAQFKELASRRSVKELLLPYHANSASSKPGNVLYFSSLILSNLNRPAGMLIIRLKPDVLGGILAVREGAERGQVLLVGQNDRFYQPTPPLSAQHTLPYAELLTKPDTFTRTLGGEQITVSHMASASMPVEYVSRVSTDVFLHKVHSIRTMMLSYVAVCLLAGVVISCIMAKRNYTPLEKLKRMLGSKLSSVEKTAATDEYGYLEASLRALLDEESKAKDMLQKQAQTRRNNLLSRLLKGKLSATESLTDMQRANRIVLGGELFMVALCQIEHVEGDALSKVQDDMDASELVFSIIQQTGEELLSEQYDAYAAEVDGVIAFIVSAGDGSAVSFVDGCQRVMEKVIAFLSDHFSITLSVCLSTVKYGMEELPDAYSETLLAHEHRAFMNDQTAIIRCGAADRAQAQGGYGELDFSRQRMLTNCMAAKDFEGAHRIIDAFLSGDCPRVMSIQQVKIRLFGLLNIVLSAAWDSYSERMTAFWGEVDPISRLLAAKSVTELNRQVCDIFDALATWVDGEGKSQVPDCVLAAEEYMQKHYTEPELSVSVIAEQLGISLSYLSRTFKKYRGVGPLDCIHMLRIEKAKALLHAGSTHQVAEQVGYYDAKAMNRAFRRYEGITPAKMRDMTAGET